MNAPHPSARRAGQSEAIEIEIVLLRKADGPLTKQINLGPDGEPVSDGSACRMSRGDAGRLRVDLDAFAKLIVQMESCEAIALGALRADLPDNVAVVVKAKLAGDNGTIARTREAIDYRPDAPAAMLIDVDRKGMPMHVEERIEELGGIDKALEFVLPELADCGRIVRNSTSAGLYRSDTGERFHQSKPGKHYILLVMDGADIERSLNRLHDRCWLAGLRWMMVGEGGQLLNRSLVDRMVFAPERLVVEGPPVLLAPIAQDPQQRIPLDIPGPPLDTHSAVRELTVVEKATLARLRAKECHRLKPEAEARRARFIEQHATRIVERTGCKPEEARKAVERLCGGTLLLGVILPFHDPELAGVTVADVLADPERYVGERLSDPLEGPSYGAGKAMIMRRGDGSLWL